MGQLAFELINKRFLQEEAALTAHRQLRKSVDTVEVEDISIYRAAFLSTLDMCAHLKFKGTENRARRCKMFKKCCSITGCYYVQCSDCLKTLVCYYNGNTKSNCFAEHLLTSAYEI